MMAKEKRRVAPKLSLRQKSKEESVIRKRRRQEEHKREAEISSIRQETKAAKVAR